MNRLFLQDDTVRLRAMEPEDLTLLYTIENDPEIWDMGTVMIPYSHYTLHHFIATTQNDLYADRQLRLVVTLKETGEAIGLVDLFHFEPHHSRAEVGIVLLRDYRGKGLALKALNLLVDYASEVLHLHSLSAWVASDNEQSCRLFSAAAFDTAGVLDDWFMTSEGFKNVVLFQYISVK